MDRKDNKYNDLSNSRSSSTDRSRAQRPLTEEEIRRRQHLREERRRKKRRKQQLIRAAVIAGLVITLILIIFIFKSIFGFIGSLFYKSEESVVEETAVIQESQTYTASILSAGDVILHSPMIDSLNYQNEDGTYNYDSIFTYIGDTYESSDFTIVNLESTISESNYSGYPLFRAPAAIGSALRDYGADFCLLANNHIYDNADSGLTMTTNALNELQIPYIGVRNSTEESTYSIQDINGIKVGIFNYTYETGSVDQKAINGITVSDQSSDLINSFNYDNLDTFYNTIEADLQSMKEAGVEYTIAYLHWGIEYQTTENETQNQIAQKLCDLGIDALIGGHPHVIQPVDLLTSTSGDHEMLCVYSMGNHLSNQRQELMDSLPTGETEDGLMVEITLEQTDDGPVSLTSVEFIPTWVYKNIVNGNAEYYIFPLNSTESYTDVVTSLDLSADIEASLARTNAIIGEGSEKIKNALPISTESSVPEAVSSSDSSDESTVEQ